jgi:hypothetical protein
MSPRTEWACRGFRRLKQCLGADGDRLVPLPAHAQQVGAREKGTDCHLSCHLTGITVRIGLSPDRVFTR